VTSPRRSTRRVLRQVNEYSRTSTRRAESIPRLRRRPETCRRRRHNCRSGTRGADAESDIICEGLRRVELWGGGLAGSAGCSELDHLSGCDCCRDRSLLRRNVDERCPRRHLRCTCDIDGHSGSPIRVAPRSTRRHDSPPALQVASIRQVAAARRPQVPVGARFRSYNSRRMTASSPTCSLRTKYDQPHRS
jgi:hypothetical protein